MTPRYAKPQKNKTIKVKLTLQHRIEYSFLTQQNPYYMPEAATGSVL